MEETDDKEEGDVLTPFWNQEHGLLDSVCEKVLASSSSS